jgi:hypothetical protein
VVAMGGSVGTGPRVSLCDPWRRPRNSPRERIPSVVVRGPPSEKFAVALYEGLALEWRQGLALLVATATCGLHRVRWYAQSDE